MTKGIFVMIDGLDGAGKGTIVTGLQAWAEKEGLKVFDLREYAKEHKDLPEIEELKDYDVILSAEPTFAKLGHEIRFELIRDNPKRRYSGTSIAHAYALDREILHRKVIIPAREQGKIIFQERGVSTSLIYQPTHEENLLVSDILKLPGNALALDNAPDLLFIPLIDPEEAMKRTKARSKDDQAIFETLEFQKKIKERYTAEWFKDIFEKRGTQVIYMDTAPPKTPQLVQAEAVNQLCQFIEKNA